MFVKKTRSIRSLVQVGAHSGGVTWVNFCWVCAAGLLEPLPHYSLPLLVNFGQICNFRNSNLSLSIFNELTQFLDWMKNRFTFRLQYKQIGTFANINMKNCLTPKNPKMCDPILVTLLKMRRHCSQSSRENVTPSSGTSPLASYKEVPPPPEVPIRMRWTPTWCLLTKLYQFELNLGEGLCIFTSFHFPDSELYLNGLDFIAAFYGMTVKTSMSCHKPETAYEKSKVQRK